MSGTLVGPFLSNKKRLSHFLTGRKECTVLYTTIKQKTGQAKFLLCARGMRVRGCVHSLCNRHSSALRLCVCVCVCLCSVEGEQPCMAPKPPHSQIPVKDANLRPSSLLCACVCCMCSFWVNWLKMPFSPGQSLSSSSHSWVPTH